MPIDICLGRFNASWFSWCMQMPAYSIRTHRAKYGGEESLRSINRSERLPANREGRSRDVRYLIVGEYFSRWTEFWGIVRLVEDEGGLMTQLFNVCALFILGLTSPDASGCHERASCVPNRVYIRGHAPCDHATAKCLPKSPAAPRMASTSWTSMTTGILPPPPTNPTQQDCSEMTKASSAMSSTASSSVIGEGCGTALSSI